MIVHIQYIQMPTSESLSAIVSQNLEKVANKYQFVIRADVTFKLGNAHDGTDKICEIELSAPGPRLFAKSNTDNFEKSAAETVKDLERQLRKRKEKFENH
ncbi:HPF/RaiA family ribosome-associated protein [Maribacter sp. ACAM166]|uniref:HPF/RaiA family ribosome-associated protein n=1 Tax=Maribacter sp. ACAM166 TaxID=2508996 RepID=UPI0010FE9E5C|nr:HPF/RaiA family ribosome-associated protein [Maribacter sp. ACAM166]TLP77284.1 HPF/RaiA family ribosome-associated protein [Maribacter sp. ACAM166]